MMKVDFFDKADFDRIYNYLLDKYFTGFWHNYNFSIILCRSDEPLQIGTVNENIRKLFQFF